MHWPHLAALNRWTLGFLELSPGEPARAWPALREVARTPTWRGLEVVSALADAVDALAALGELEAVDELVGTLDDEARHGHRLAGPAALRSRALSLLAQGDAAEAAALAERQPTPSRQPVSRSTVVAHCSSPVKRSAARGRAGAPPRSSRRRQRSSPASERICGHSGPRRSCSGRGLDPGAIAS